MKHSNLFSYILGLGIGIIVGFCLLSFLLVHSGYTFFWLTIFLIATVIFGFFLVHKK